MQQDDYETAVLFRVARLGEHKGEVTAVFPACPADMHGRTLTCYSHIGQHSACSLDWLRTTRPATPDEYAALKAELEGAPYGYRLRIYDRRTAEIQAAFNHEVWRMNQPQVSAQ